MNWEDLDPWRQFYRPGDMVWVEMEKRYFAGMVVGYRTMRPPNDGTKKEYNFRKQLYSVSSPGYKFYAFKNRVVFKVEHWQLTPRMDWERKPMERFEKYFEEQGKRVKVKENAAAFDGFMDALMAVYSGEKSALKTPK